MDSINTVQLRDMLIAASRAIIENEPLLTQIDRLIGDGDHGVGMTAGFCAVQKMLIETPVFEDTADMFKQAGVVLIDTIGGASGVLYGTLFISGAHRLTKSETMTAADFACFLTAGTDAIRRRGKAEAGDKTMLDALIPAAEGMSDAAAKGESFESCLRRAASRAREGAEATKKMQARAGRAKAYAAASIGHPDAGATSSAILITALAECAQVYSGNQ